ncbi:MAG TPA: hypothetical protein VFH22_12235, partial [Rhodocyclaceae bacterium]|nr:hypothetical protein [Rhodocyclaceae bacterium]
MNESCNASSGTKSNISVASAKTLEVRKDLPYVNNITITTNSGMESSAATESKHGQIIVNPQPLKLNIETSTDWPTVMATFLVGIGSILITSMVGWLSFSSQRMQIRSNIANFRN